jgi:hypothetical protein
MKEKIERTIIPQAISKAPFLLTSVDIETLKAECYSEDDIQEIERFFENVHFSISFFDLSTPANSFKKDLTTEEAEKILTRKHFISAVAQAIMNRHHYSISRIYETNGTSYLECHM